MEYDKRVDAILTGYGYSGDYKMKLFSWLDDLGYKGDLLDKVRVWRRNGSPFTAVDGSIGQVTDGQTFEVTGGTVTISVDDGVVSADFVADEE